MKNSMLGVTPIRRSARLWLPAPTGLLHFKFDEPNDVLGVRVQGLRQLEYRGERRLLLPKFEQADEGARRSASKPRPSWVKPASIRSRRNTRPNATVGSNASSHNRRKNVAYRL